MSPNSAIETDDELKRERRRQERRSVRQSRMLQSSSSPPVSASPRARRRDTVRVSKRGSGGIAKSSIPRSPLRESTLAAIRGPSGEVPRGAMRSRMRDSAIAAIRAPDVAADIQSREKGAAVPSGAGASRPGAYQESPTGVEVRADDDDDDDDDEPQNGISTVKRQANPRRAAPPPVLQSARVVTDKERRRESMVLDEVEKARIQRMVQREVEERIKSTVALAKVDDSENKSKSKRKKIICWAAFIVFILAVIGVVVGVVLATRSGGSKSEPDASETSPTPGPTPFIGFDSKLDTCEGADDLTGMVGLPILGSTKGSNVDRFDTCEIIERNGHGVWYRIVGDSKTKVASTCNNTFFDTQLSIYSGNCTQPRCVSGNDQIRCGNGDQSQVAWLAEEGAEYFIHVHGQRSSQGVYELTLVDVEDNDQCEAATEVMFNSDLPVFGTTRGKSSDRDVAEKCGLARQLSAGVWYTLPGVDGDMVAFAETSGLTAFRPQLSVYEGNNCAELACVTGSVSESAEWIGEAGKRYHILVHGLGASEGDFQFRVSAILDLPEPPPQDDDGLLACEMAADIPAGSSGRGNTFFGPVSDAETCGPEITNTAQGKWFKTTGTGDAMVASTCETTTDLDTQVSVYRGNDCDSLECVDGNDQSCGDRSSVVWFSDIGEQYFVFVQGTAGRTGEFNLTIDSEQTLGEPLVVTSSTCDDATMLPVDLGSVLGSFADADTPTVGACASDVVGGEPGVWYAVDGIGGPMSVSGCDSSQTQSLRLLVFTGSCGALKCIEATSTPCGSQESITWPTVEGERYYVLAQSRSPVDDSQQVEVGDGGFTLYAGATVIHNLCKTPIGPLVADNEPIFGALWSATIGKTPACNITDGPTGRGVWYSVIGTGQRLVSHTCSDLTSFDAQIRVFQGDCEDGFNLGCVFEQERRSCENGQEIAIWQSEPDVLYYLLVSGFSPVASSNFALSVSTGNDICFGAEQLSLGGPATEGTTLDATVDDEDSVPTCAIESVGEGHQSLPSESSPGVWYEVTGDGGIMTASTCGSSSFDSAVTVFGGPSCERLSCVEGATHERCDGADNSNGVGMRTSWQSVEGEKYHVLVFGGTGVGNFDISLTSSDVRA